MLQQVEQVLPSIEVDALGEQNLERGDNGSPRALGPRYPALRSRQPRPRVSVVIAAMNEAENLPYVFSRLPEGLHEVIIVDGYSVDETIAVARTLRPDVRILTQSGRGKGNAMA